MMTNWRPTVRTVLLITLWLTATLHPSAVAAQDALAVADYWRAVDETQAKVAQLAGAPATPETERMRQLAAEADRWRTIVAVVLPDGAQVAVDHSALIAELTAASPDLARVEAQLAALATARHNWPDVSFTAADLAPLTSILAQPAFDYTQPEAPALWRWLMEQWEQFLAWLEGLLPIPAAGEPGLLTVPLVEQVATLVLLVLLAALVIYVLRGVLADLAAEASLAPEEQEAGEPLTADTALQRAQARSDEGDYRAAVRYLYLSTLLRLEERGLLRYERALTNREVLRRVAHDPTLATVLRDVVDVFDRVWYGYQPLDGPAYQRYASAVEALKTYR